MEECVTDRNGVFSITQSIRRKRNAWRTKMASSASRNPFIERRIRNGPKWRLRRRAIHSSKEEYVTDQVGVFGVAQSIHRKKNTWRTKTASSASRNRFVEVRIREGPKWRRCHAIDLSKKECVTAENRGRMRLSWRYVGAESDCRSGLYMLTGQPRKNVSSNGIWCSSSQALVSRL